MNQKLALRLFSLMGYDADVAGERHRGRRGRRASELRRRASWTCRCRRWTGSRRRAGSGRDSPDAGAADRRDDRERDGRRPRSVLRGGHGRLRLEADPRRRARSRRSRSTPASAAAEQRSSRPSRDGSERRRAPRVHAVSIASRRQDGVRSPPGGCRLGLLAQRGERAGAERPARSPSACAPHVAPLSASPPRRRHAGPRAGAARLRGTRRSAPRGTPGRRRRSRAARPACAGRVRLLASSSRA